MKEAKKSSVRLSTHIVPEKYQLTLKPDLESFTFEGSETIFISVQKPTSSITLHSKDLQIESAEALQGKKDIWAGEISYDEKSETATFTFPKKIPARKIQLKLTFRGILTDSMRGFYRSRYEHDGKEKHLATTQFEATDARRAFPCFDEPSQKAVFEVKLIVPGETTAISNTLETSIVEHEGGYKIVEFAPSPRMSTYLLAFLVGEFEYVEDYTEEGVRIRIYTTPGKKHQANFALEVGKKVLSFYNNYFDIKYPLPVLDMIAVPDFSSGAMENWGAITYRETALLVDPEHSSAQNKQWVALVIAHEIAHQWFGNLVTMEWWTHLWLNEGFASYIEFLAVAHLFPEWDVWNQYSFDTLGEALKLDGLASTHPIEVDVHHPDEIGEIFDAVSYSKGSCVIRMLAEYLGHEKFRDGLRHYLKKHSYKNTVTEDLWESLEKISKKPVREMMKNWTGKPGYPLVSVSKYKDTLKLTQERFFSSAISKQEQPDKTVWHVPVGITSDKTSKPVYGSFGQRIGYLPQPKLGEWFKINAGETSFFRTRYEKQDLLALKKPIEEKALSVLDRLGIIRDVFALAEAGYIPTVEALELAESYKNETDYNVWIELISGLSNIGALIDDRPYYEAFTLFAKNLLSTIAQEVGWNKAEGEAHTRTLLRSIVLRSYGHYGDKATVKQSQKMFAEMVAGRTSIDPDLRGAVYGLTAEYGNSTEYAEFLKRYKQEKLHEEKSRLGRALGQFKKEPLLQKTLKFAFSKEVRAQDAPGLIMSVYMNRVGKHLAYKFVKASWDLILKRYDPSTHMLPRFLQPAEQFHTQADLKDFQKFIKTHPTPGADRAAQQTLESIKSNIIWLKKDGKELGKWLQRKI